MNTTPYQAILKHGFQQANNSVGWRGPAVLLSLVLVPALALLFWGRPQIASFMSCLLPLAISTPYWCGLVVNLMQQNHPSAAHLVPAHASRLRHVLVALWLMFSLLTAGLLVALGLSPVAAWLLSTWGLAALGVLMRWPLGWAVLSGLPFLLVWSYRHGLFADAAALMDARPLLCVMLSLLLPPLALLQVLGDGGAAHREGHARAQRWRELGRQGAATKGWDNSKLASAFSWIGRLTGAPYRHELRRLSVSRDLRTIGPRLMLGLGPGGHWTAQLSGLMVFGFIVALVFLVVAPLVPIRLVDFVQGAGFGMTIGLTSAFLSPLYGLNSALLKTSKEQRLLVLLPGMPRGIALNRLLARRWLLQFGLSWLLVLVVAMALVIWGNAPIELLLTYLMANLLLAAQVLRDWARSQVNNLTPVLAVSSVIFTAGLGYSLYRWADVPLWLVASTQVVLALGMGARGWRKQVSAPQALPVGRLA